MRILLLPLALLAALALLACAPAAPVSVTLQSCVVLATGRATEEATGQSWPAMMLRCQSGHVQPSAPPPPGSGR